MADKPCGCSGSAKISAEPNPSTPEAERLLRAAGHNIRVQPASEVIRAVRNYDQKSLMFYLSALGVPIGTPLGQSLMRLSGR